MLEWLLLHTAESTALAVVVWLVCRRLPSRPAVRHALWLVVLAKLLTPPLVHWPWSLPAFRTPAPAEVAAQTTPTVPPPCPSADEDPPAFPAAKANLAPPAVEVVVSPPAAEAPKAEVATPEPVAPALTVPAATGWRDWLLVLTELLWVAGGCAAGLVQLVRVFRLRRKLRTGSAAPVWLESLTAEAAQTLGVRPPRVVVLADAASPMVCALGPPCLLWPMGLEERLPADGRRAVVLHELAHLRRRDHWVGWLLLAAGCVWWWHPLLAFVRRRLNREAELACDAWVVAAAPEARRAYAEALLEVSQRPSLEAAPVLGAASGRRELERRLVMIMHGSGPGRLSWRALVGIGALGLLVLPAWSPGGDAPKAPAAEAPLAAAPATPAEPPVGYEPVTTLRPVTHLEPVTVYQPTKATGEADKPGDHDRRIQELEAKVKDLMKQLEALQSTAPPATPSRTVETNERNIDVAPAVDVRTAAAEPAVKENAEIRLSRVTYKLPAGHAEATATFLRGHVGASVLETRAEGDNLVVTTTPETQQVIRTFVALIQARGPEAPPAAPGGAGPSPEAIPGVAAPVSPADPFVPSPAAAPPPAAATPPLPTAPEAPKVPSAAGAPEPPAAVPPVTPPTPARIR